MPEWNWYLDPLLVAVLPTFEEYAPPALVSDFLRAYTLTSRRLRLFAVSSTVSESPLDLDVAFQAHRLRLGFFERMLFLLPFPWTLADLLLLLVNWYHEIISPRFIAPNDYPPDVLDSRKVIDARVDRFLYLLSGMRYVPILDKARRSRLLATRTSSTPPSSDPNALPGDSFLAAMVTGSEPVVEEASEDDSPVAEDKKPSSPRRYRTRSPLSPDEPPPPPLSQKPLKRKKTPLFYSTEESEPPKEPVDKGKRKAVSPPEDDSDRDAEGEDEDEGEEEVDEIEEEEPPKKKPRTSPRKRQAPVVELSPRNKKPGKKPKSTHQASVDLPCAVQIEGDCDECRRVGATCERPDPSAFRCNYCKKKGKAVSCAYDHLSVQGTVKGECPPVSSFHRPSC